MSHEKKHDLQQAIETKFELINLKLQASRIRNSQNLQDGIDALIQFIGGKRKTVCFNM